MRKIEGVERVEVVENVLYVGTSKAETRINQSAAADKLINYQINK